MTQDRPATSAQGEAPRRWFPPPPSISWALGIAAAVLILYISRQIVVLLLLSAALAYIISPLVKMAESVLIKRDAAVSAIYLGLVLVLLAAGSFLLPRLRAEVNTLIFGSPSLTERLDQAVDAIQNELIAEYPAARRLLGAPERRNEWLGAFIDKQTENLPDIITQLASMALGIVLIPFFSYFLLRDSRKMVQYFMDRLPPTHIETSVAVWCEIDRSIGRYLRGLAIDGMVVGTVAALGLWSLGVNSPLLLGALSGLTNVVPYFGPILSGVANTVIAIIQFKSLAPVGKVLTLYLSIKILDITVIHPLAVGKSVHLHPILLITSVLVGGHAFGLIGMIIAVPMVTTLQEVTRLLLERRRYHMGLRKAGHGTPVQPYVC